MVRGVRFVGCNGCRARPTSSVALVPSVRARPRNVLVAFTTRLALILVLAAVLGAVACRLANEAASSYGQAQGSEPERASARLTLSARINCPASVGRLQGRLCAARATGQVAVVAEGATN